FMAASLALICWIQNNTTECHEAQLFQYFISKLLLPRNRFVFCKRLNCFKYFWQRSLPEG
ncbi:MAG: hypothetical protein KKB30_09385, partial [Proteobacteria bacterium]|nr:hypothetical protein [Pseudomonadota bacterium]MBU1714135.1 hypothetical protein [Pseudomonadota bacterium]